MRFNGSDYDPDLDNSRLSNQLIRIRELMKDQTWRTLYEIRAVTGDPESSISAQLRHLRKERFGSWVVEKRSRGHRNIGLFEYRVMPPGYDSEFVMERRVNKYHEILRLVYREFPTTQEFIMKEINKRKSK